MPSCFNVNKTLISPLLITLLATGCSSDGPSDDTDNSGSLRKITVSDLSFSEKYYEGETVTLSLDAEGEGSEQLSFNWEVSHGIDFEGQGTDTITFVAPEVTGIDSISASVEMSLDDGTLLGERDQRGYLTVLDTDPPNILSVGFATELPEVASLNLDLVEGVQHFAIDTYERADVSLAGQASALQRVTKRTAVVLPGDGGELTVRLCGGQTVAPLSELAQPAGTETAACGGEAPTSKYYQIGADLRAEMYCGEQIVYARNIRGSDADVRAVQGQVLFSEDGFEVLQDSMQACMGRTDAMASYYDETRDSPMKYVIAESTRFLMEVTQPGGPVVFDIVGNKIVSSFEEFSLHEFFNDSGLNSVVITAPNHPKLDGLKATDGSVSIRNLEQDEYEIGFEVDFETETDPRVEVDVTSTLYLP